MAAGLALVPSGRRRRCLVGAVALAATALAGTGCGMLRPQEASSSPSDETGSDHQLCVLFGSTLEMFGDPSMDALLTSDELDLFPPIGVIALIATNRSGEVDDLGPYRAGVQAVERRGRDLIERSFAVGLGDRLPSENVTKAERASARAADAVLADGACRAER